MSISLLTVILIVTVIASLNGFSNRTLLDRWIYIPYEVKHHHAYERMFTHMLIHADVMHLAFNMMSLYFLGSYLEYQLVSTYGVSGGELQLVIIYVGGGLFSTIIPYIRHQDNSNYRSLGASGAVSSVIFATIIWDPTLPLSIMFLPIAIPAYIFGPLYLAFEYWADRRGGTGIAHDAHIGGALFGIIYVLITNIDKGKFFLQLIFG
jgi:membrane associated rhomboid family serine protease